MLHNAVPNLIKKLNNNCQYKRCLNIGISFFMEQPALLNSGTSMIKYGQGLIRLNTVRMPLGD